MSHSIMDFNNNKDYLSLRHASKQHLDYNHAFRLNRQTLNDNLPQNQPLDDDNEGDNYDTQSNQKSSKDNTITKSLTKSKLFSTKSDKKSVKSNLNQQNEQMNLNQLNQKQQQPLSDENAKQKCRKRNLQKSMSVKQKLNKTKTKNKTLQSHFIIKSVKSSQQQPQQSQEPTQASEQVNTKDAIQQQQYFQQKYQVLQDTNKNSQYPYCDQLQQSSGGISIPWVPILCVLLGILLIGFIIWLINAIRKRIATTQKYNDTPQNFIQKPTLSLNQSKNLKLHSVKPFDNYKEADVIVENKTQYGGNIYEIKFMNNQSKTFSATYWSKTLKTDCYFEIQIETLHSEIQFGFINKKYFSLINSGVQTKIGRVGVSLNSEGNLQLLGEIKYQFRWNLQYGDVIGLGITELDKTKRVWATKNGALLNPPTSDQVEKWLSKEALSQQHRDAYYSLNEQGKGKNLNRKQDMQLIKKRISLPASEDFEYYAVIGSLEMKSTVTKKSKKYSQTNKIENNEQKLVTVVRFNVGGKTFRLRDNNLRSGLLADSIQKNQFCNWLPCF